jgi:prephenate dehydratase
MRTNPLKVAIQGDRASFHEIAALNYYEQPIELMYCRTFDEVFDSLLSGVSQRAFVAVRNTSHGDIDEVKKLLSFHRFNHEGEYRLPIDQHLIGLPGTELNTVKRVLSHPVALSQCSSYLDTHLSHAEKSEYYDTSAAVGHIKKLADSSCVAVGSERAAKLHGLIILKESIQNDTDNATIFHSLTA